jgi:hypothetical protein
LKYSINAFVNNKNRVKLFERAFDETFMWAFFGAAPIVLATLLLPLNWISDVIEWTMSFRLLSSGIAPECIPAA